MLQTHKTYTYTRSKTSKQQTIGYSAGRLKKSMPITARVCWHYHFTSPSRRTPKSMTADRTFESHKYFQELHSIQPIELLTFEVVYILDHAPRTVHPEPAVGRSSMTYMINTNRCCQHKQIAASTPSKFQKVHSDGDSF